MTEMKHRHDRSVSLAGALERPRYEVIPLPGVAERILKHIPREVELTVTASPTKGLGPTVDLTELLMGEGYRVAPHLSARLISDDSHLKDIACRLHEAGVKDVFAIAGDAPKPAGKFAGSVDLLAALAETGTEFEQVGIGGYPERHPLISDETTVQAMNDKLPYATYIVSQICFQPRLIESWVERVRDRGVQLPIYVGIPGSVSMTKLMRISGSIGLGDSARFLKKYGNRFLRMLLPGGYTPDGLVADLAPQLNDPWSNLRGFHVYTFNELENTESWRQSMLERLRETT
ncbi:methylenetetrahydrofolate reductase [soil metagenome]|jgi:methylenetetrahydrofolate reductase (NADPH)